jgi:hypothetical protein
LLRRRFLLPRHPGPVVRARASLPCLPRTALSRGAGGRRAEAGGSDRGGWRREQRVRASSRSTRRQAQGGRRLRAPGVGARARLAFPVALFASELHDEGVKLLLVSVVGLLLAIIVGGGCSSSEAPPSCTTSADCASHEVCAYKIGSCAAEGQCVALSSGPQVCGSCPTCLPGYCGCNGSLVGSECKYPDGYAPEPTMGIKPHQSGLTVGCGDGGPSEEDSAVADSGPMAEASGDATAE